MDSQIQTEYIKKHVPAGKVKVGDVVIIKGKPCKVISVVKSKTGKHGAAKTMIGLRCPEGTKMTEVFPVMHKVETMVEHVSEEPEVDELEPTLTKNELPKTTELDSAFVEKLNRKENND